MWIKAEDAQHHLCPQQLISAGHCQGSRCMAWRDHPHAIEDGVHFDTGYCGLAGPPQRAVLDGERESEDYQLGVDRRDSVASTPWGVKDS